MPAAGQSDGGAQIDPGFCLSDSVLLIFNLFSFQSDSCPVVASWMNLLKIDHIVTKRSG